MRRICLDNRREARLASIFFSGVVARLYYRRVSSERLRASASTSRVQPGLKRADLREAFIIQGLLVVCSK